MHKLKKNINPVSFVGRNDYNPYSNIPPCTEESTELEIEEDPSKFCRQCKQLNSYCHRIVYQEFIKRKLFSIYSNQLKSPSLDKIKEEMKIAYNEKRRVEIVKEFHLYDQENIDMPPCLISYLFRLRSLIHEVTEATKINFETREGVSKYIAAKRMRMC